MSRARQQKVERTSSGSKLRQTQVQPLTCFFLPVHFGAIVTFPSPKKWNFCSFYLSTMLHRLEMIFTKCVRSMVSAGSTSRTSSNSSRNNTTTTKSSALFLQLSPLAVPPLLPNLFSSFHEPAVSVPKSLKARYVGTVYEFLRGSPDSLY